RSAAGTLRRPRAGRGPAQARRAAAAGRRAELGARAARRGGPAGTPDPAAADRRAAGQAARPGPGRDRQVRAAHAAAGAGRPRLSLTGPRRASRTGRARMRASQGRSPIRLRLHSRSLVPYPTRTLVDLWLVLHTPVSNY